MNEEGGGGQNDATVHTALESVCARLKCQNATHRAKTSRTIFLNISTSSSGTQADFQNNLYYIAHEFESHFWERCFLCAKSFFFAKLMFLNTLINNHFKPRIIFLLTHVVQKVNLRLRDVHFCCRFFDFVFVRYVDFDFVRYFDFDFVRYFDFDFVRYFDFDFAKYFDFDCARCFDLSSVSFTEQQDRSNLWGQCTRQDNLSPQALRQICAL